MLDRIRCLIVQFCGTIDLSILAIFLFGAALMVWLLLGS